jgi:hypothetical protein
MRQADMPIAGNRWERRFRTLAASALAVALSACASHTAMRPSSSNPVPSSASNASTNPTPAAKTCPAGNGAVVRVVPINAAGRNANADLMNGGVVGSVLADPHGGQAQGGASGGSGTNTGVVRYDFYVRLDKGDRIIISQRDAAGIVAGSRVTVEGCRARLIR